MRPYWLAIFVLLFAWTIAPRKLVKTKLNSQISVALPKELVVVPPEAVPQYSQSVRQPIGFFANADYTVFFSVNTSATSWPDANLDIARQFFKSNIYNLYGAVDWLSEGIREIRSKHYVYFEFNVKINQGEHEAPLSRYICIQYLVEPGYTFVFSFGCLKRLADDWQSTAHAMMKNIHVK